MDQQIEKLFSCALADTFEDVVLRMIRHHQDANPSHYCHDGQPHPAEFVRQVEDQYRLWQERGLAASSRPLVEVRVVDEPGGTPRHTKRYQWQLSV